MVPCRFARPLVRPDVFVGTLAEKLLTYALGRKIEFYDMPAVRTSSATQRKRIGSPP